MDSSSTAGPSKPPQSQSQSYDRKPFVAADHRIENDGVFRVLLISTGSVASIRVPNIVGALSTVEKLNVQVVGTKASLHFYSEDDLRSYIHKEKGESAVDKEGEGDVRIWRDEDEWADWKKIGDPILHIELRRWADLVVVAPCSADFLAKLAAGLCDSLPLSILRALTPDTPVILFPAMNTYMYQHPLTGDHLKVVTEKLGYGVSGPQGAGNLACGDEGPGKMTDWREVVSTIKEYAAKFHGKREASVHLPTPPPPHSP